MIGIAILRCRLGTPLARTELQLVSPEGHSLRTYGHLLECVGL